MASRYKSPLSTTLLLNTENVQRCLRRCLFRYHFQEEVDEQAQASGREEATQQYRIILKFFERAE